MCPTPVPYRDGSPVDGLTPLSERERLELAGALPVTPQSVIAYAGLRRGLDRAFVVGPPRDPEAVIVQHRGSPREPEYFGRDPEAGWSLLSRIPGWTSLNGSTEAMAGFEEIFARKVPLPFRRVGDLFHTLEGPPVPHPDPAVRLLGLSDIPVLSRFEPEAWGNSYRTFEEMVTDGVVAAALVEGRIVSVALLSAQNARFGDIGVHTLAPFRRRGFSTAAASLVAGAVRARGLVPIWSTGRHNLASRRVAAKVGFRPAGEGVYLVFDGLAKSGFRPT